MPFRVTPLTAVVLSIACLPFAAAAQSFEDLERQLASHPAILELQYEADGARNLAVAETALPDPEFSVGVDDFPIHDPQYYGYVPVNTEVGVRQAIPNRASRRARSEGELASARRFDTLRAARLDALRGELIVLLLERSRIDRQRALLDERAGLYAELTDVVSAEIDAGRPAIFRLAEIESERAVLGRERAALEAGWRQVEAKLTELIGDLERPPAPIETAGEWTGDPQVFHTVRAARAELGIFGAGVDEARADWQPDWGVQLTYELRDERRGPFGESLAGDDVLGAMVTFSLPIWGEKSQAPRTRAAKSALEAARSREAAALRSAVAQLDGLEAMRDQASRSQDSLRANIEAIEDAVASQLIVYESGNGDYAPVLDGQIAILKLRAEIIMEETLAASATARINAILVTP